MGRSRRQQAEDDLREFFANMIHGATIYNIINIFCGFLKGCFEARFDQTHIELWNEVIHEIVGRFSQDQQRVLYNMVI